MHYGWRFVSGSFDHSRRLFLKLLVFLLAGSALTADLRGGPSHGDYRVGHVHHLIGDAIRLMLQRIVNRSDPELNLNGLVRCARCEALVPLRPIREHRLIAYSKPMRA